MIEELRWETIPGPSAPRSFRVFQHLQPLAGERANEISTRALTRGIEAETTRNFSSCHDIRRISGAISIERNYVGNEGSIIVRINDLTGREIKILSREITFFSFVACIPYRLCLELKRFGGDFRKRDQFEARLPRDKMKMSRKNWIKFVSSSLKETRY